MLSKIFTLIIKSIEQLLYSSHIQKTKNKNYSSLKKILYSNYYE